MEAGDLVNITEAAELVGVSRVTIYAMIREGKLGTVKVSDRYFLYRGEVRRYRSTKGKKPRVLAC